MRPRTERSYTVALPPRSLASRVRSGTELPVRFLILSSLIRVSFLPVAIYLGAVYTSTPKPSRINTTIENAQAKAAAVPTATAEVRQRLRRIAAPASTNPAEHERALGSLTASRNVQLRYSRTWPTCTTRRGAAVAAAPKPSAPYPREPPQDQHIPSHDTVLLPDPASRWALGEVPLPIFVTLLSTPAYCRLVAHSLPVRENERGGSRR